MSNGQFIVVMGALLLAGLPNAHAQNKRYDRSIEAAMEKRAASRIGDIRGTIGYDETPVLVTRVHLGIGDSSETTDESVLISSTAPSKAREKLDLGTTASVPRRKDTSPFLKPPEAVVWDKFDRYGRPILD